MTRSEEIKEARHKWYLRTQDADFCAGFQKGAEWADAHPDIDVRTMAAWQSGYNEAIEKACEWLHSALYLDHERSIEHRYATLEELLNDFRKAMNENK